MTVAAVREPLKDFGRVFLDELSRANRSFARSQTELAATFDVRSLSAQAGPTLQAALQEAMRAQITNSQLLITQAEVSFWVEPVPPSWFRRVLAWFGVGRLQEVQFRLASEQGTLRCELTIARADAGELAIVAQRFDAQPLARSEAP
jgi:hypothetical protein